jgi:prepilin-type N-terminal cleavage/methylation domain-containing protein
MINLMKRNGFALLELVIVLAIVAFVAGGGWHFTHLQNEQSAVNAGISAEQRAQQVVQQTNQQTEQKQNALNQITGNSTFEDLSFSPFSVKQLLYPSFSWSMATSSFVNLTSTVPQSEIEIDAVSRAKYGTLTIRGQEWQSVVNASTSATSPDFSTYYDNLYANYMTSVGQYNSSNQGFITLGGYQFDPLDADGVGGSYWGYLFKNGSYEQLNPLDYTKDTIRELTLSSQQANADGSLCEADSCQYVRYTVFWSDPMTIGDILNQASWR